MAGSIQIGSDIHKQHLDGLEKDKVAEDPAVGKKESILREDGPTVEEFVKSGYDPKNYPPAEYKSKSTKKEIAKAIADFEQKTP